MRQILRSREFSVGVAKSWNKFNVRSNESDCLACPDRDSVALTKESSFFKLEKEGEKKKRGRDYCTVVDLESLIFAALNCC
jgi:hypothetical protein